MLVGREAECARLHALLDGARAGRSGVVLLRGEAGAGKTALLDAVVAGAGDLLVLRAQGVESESELSYAALYQLLRPVAGDLDGLAAPQADALRSAFGLRAGGADERFLLSLAVLSLLGELSERRPVLCVLDDAHWLDRGSVDALPSAARRLEAERAALVLAVRDPTARGVPVPDLPTLRVGALSPDAGARVLEEHAGVAVHADVRLRLVEATGGNALALVELACALSAEELRGEHPPPVPLPLTSGVEQAFLDRVRRLPDPTHTLLLVAAADDTARLTTVAAAGARLGVELDELAAAEHAGVVAAEGDALRFRHPLVRSAVYQGANSTDRRGSTARSPRCSRHPAMRTAPPGSGPRAPSGPTPTPPQRWTTRPPARASAGLSPRPPRRSNGPPSCPPNRSHGPAGWPAQPFRRGSRAYRPRPPAAREGPAPDGRPGAPGGHRRAGGDGRAGRRRVGHGVPAAAAGRRGDRPARPGTGAGDPDVRRGGRLDGFRRTGRGGARRAGRCAGRGGRT